MITCSQSQLNQIKAAAEAAYPSECCGLLVGSGNSLVVSRVVSSPNLLTDQGPDRFEIDPQIRIDLERKLRGSAEQIIGHYHSHPDHLAMPSATDLAMAFEPDLIWLIVSVRDGQAAEIKTHQLDQTANKFMEVNCKIIN